MNILEGMPADSTTIFGLTPRGLLGLETPRSQTIYALLQG
jgi:hypothetical protein